jgi:prepilin signal peptidase PulO-like enzyme (type II secretory pathway)
MATFAPILITYITGMFLGSFFYTLALRYATGEMRGRAAAALFSRSKCTSCGSAVSPFHLLPVIGFLILRGKCRKCGSRISLSYPVMEIVYGALAVLVAWRLGITAYSVSVYLIIATSICISVVDIKTLTIPNSLVIALAALSAYPIIINYKLSDNLFGLLALFIVFIVVLLIFPGSFGAGDVKMASAIGLVAGLELSIVVLETSLVTGAIAGITYSLVTRKGLRTKIPFAPFLTTGLIVSFLYGREILLVYYRIFY